MQRSRIKALALALFWTCFILALLSLPNEKLPSSGLWNYDKIGHAGLFFILAITWMRVFGTGSTRIVILLLVSGFTFAPLSEWYQSVLPTGRHMDMMDSLADAIGFGLGTFAWILFEKVRSSVRDEKGSAAQQL